MIPWMFYPHQDGLVEGKVINTKLIWVIPFFLWWNISILMGMISLKGIVIPVYLSVHILVIVVKLYIHLSYLLQTTWC